MIVRLHESFRTVDWETSSRLTFGSLVILVKDENPILFTVSQRDPEQLIQGLVTLKLLDLKDEERCQTRMSHPMLESRAYFEAYRPVVRVLRKMRTVPFSKYLVDVETSAVSEPGRQFNRKSFGLSFGLNNVLRFHYGSEAFLNYPILNIFLL